MEIRSRYDAGVRAGWSSSLPSLTQQQFKDEADINYIIAMYNSSGVMPSFHGDGQPSEPIFADFAELPDSAQEMYNQMLQAKANFDNLPLDIRKRFNYDPGAFLEFVDNPNNVDELVAMGLATKTTIEQQDSNINANKLNNSAGNSVTE
jgi:hypothetical protein